MDAIDLLRDLLEGKTPRRDFLRLGGVAAFFYVVVIPILNKGQATVTRLIEGDTVTIKDPDYQHDLIFSLFGDFRRDSKFTPGTAHYLYPRAC